MEQKTENVQLIANDGVALVGTHYPVPVPSPGISLFHMMPATKESWDAFARKLKAAGIGVLAVDLRGHGQSQGGPQGYTNYTAEQHQRSQEDVAAAIGFQRKEKHDPLWVGGASIGANLALQALAQLPFIKKAVLLSPGLNYRGIETLPLARRVPADKEVFLLGSLDDPRVPGNAEQMQQICRALACKKELKIYEKGGHGTDIFTAHPGVMTDIMRWLKE